MFADKQQSDEELNLIRIPEIKIIEAKTNGILDDLRQFILILCLCKDAVREAGGREAASLALYKKIKFNSHPLKDLYRRDQGEIKLYSGPRLARDRLTSVQTPQFGDDHSKLVRYFAQIAHLRLRFARLNELLSRPILDVTLDVRRNLLRIPESYRFCNDA